MKPRGMRITLESVNDFPVNDIRNKLRVLVGDQPLRMSQKPRVDPDPRPDRNKGLRKK